MMSRVKRLSPTVALLYVWTALFVIVPLVYIIALSFMTRSESWGVEAGLTLEHYSNLFDATYVSVFKTSLTVSTWTTVLCFLIGYPFAYFTAKLKKGLRSVVLLFLMAPFWINSLVRLYGLMSILRSNGVINSALMSTGLIDEPLKLLYTKGATMVGMVYALLPIMILSIYNSVEKMDWSLVEAAQDLGAGKIRAFFTVTLPQTVPGIVAGCILVFVPSVGLFFVSDMFGGSKVMLVGNLIKNVLLNSRNWPMGAALSILLLAVTSIFLLIYRRVSKKSSLEDLV